MCDINVNQQSKPNKKNKVLTSLCKRKQIMVCFMAFSCKTGSINRCLGLDVSAPAPGGFSGLLAWLSLQLKIICQRMYLAFNFLYLICCLSASWLPVLMCLPHMNSYEPLDNRELRRRIVQKWERSTEWCRMLCSILLWGGMQKKIRTKGRTQVILGHLHSRPANEDQQDVRMMIGFEIIQAEA